MAVDVEEDSWENFFEDNRFIPLHANRRGREEGESIPYRLNLKCVEGIPIPGAVVSVTFSISACCDLTLVLSIFCSSNWKMFLHFRAFETF